jgi:hypothetical protein
LQDLRLIRCSNKNTLTPKESIMKAKLIVSALLVVGLSSLVGGTMAAFAQGPLDDPDAYTVSLIDSPVSNVTLAAAPAFVPDWAVQSDPDAYMTPADDATYAQFNYASFGHAESPVEAAAITAPATDFDPDTYTTPLTTSAAADLMPTDVNADPDAYTAPLNASTVGDLMPTDVNADPDAYTTGD